MHRLLNGRDASVLLTDLHVSARTAQRHAKAAHKAHDVGVQKIGRQYLATEAWWRDQFQERPKMGRPPRKK